MKPFEIISQVLIETKLNQSAFLEKTGVSSSTFSDIKCGKVKGISQSLANKIKRAFPDFSVSWLMTGEGSMYDGVAPGDARAVSQSDLSAALQTIDKLVTQMAEKDRQIGQLIDIIGQEKKRDAAGGAIGAAANE